MVGDQRRVLASVRVVKDAGDAREDDEDREIKPSTHSPLLTALSGKVDGNGKARRDRIRGDVAVGKSGRDKKGHGHDVIERLAAHDVIWRVPLQSQRVAGAVVLTGDRSDVGGRVRGRPVESPAGQPRLPETASHAVDRQLTLTKDEQLNREARQSSPQTIDLPKAGG